MAIFIPNKAETGAKEQLIKKDYVKINTLFALILSADNAHDSALEKIKESGSKAEVI